MKKWFSDRPLVCFLSFAALIAGRDSFSQLFLDQNVDPFFMVFCFFSVTVVLAHIYGTFNRISPQPITEGLKEKLLLGISTCSAFLLTLFGIKLIGASIFSLVEHCLIPIATFLLALKILKDKASLTMFLGIFISLISVVLFLFAINDYNFQNIREDWILGIMIAVICSVLTSISSIFQKKLLLKNHEPFQVLIVRFTLPAIMIVVICLLKGVIIPDGITILRIIFISVFFFALPLLLLLQGFVRTSMARFSIFNILIPAFTFFFNSLMFENEMSKWSSKWVILGSIGILIGHIVFEWNLFKLTLENLKSRLS